MLAAVRTSNCTALSAQGSSWKPLVWVEMAPRVANLPKEHVESARRHRVVRLDSVGQVLPIVLLSVRGQRLYNTHESIEQDRTSAVVLLGGVDVEAEPFKSPEQLLVFGQPMSQRRR